MTDYLNLGFETGEPIEDPAGYFLLFDGSDHLEGANVLAKDKDNAFTVTGWFRTSNNGVQTLAGNLQAGPGFRGWEVLQVTGQLWFQLISVNTSNEIAVRTDDAFDDGEWHFYAAIYTGGESASDVTLLIDNVEVAKTEVADTLTTTTVSSANIRVGDRSTTGGLGFVGALVNWSVHNAALTPTEATDLFELGFQADLSSGPFSIETNWAMNDDDETVTVLDTVGSNNLTINGDPEYVWSSPRRNVENDSMLADNWVSTNVGTAVEYVDFGEGSEFAEPGERFEKEWTGVNDFLFEFLPGFESLDPFIFNTGEDVDTVETFSFWSDFIFDLTRLELCKFDTDKEGEFFETGWGNDDAKFEFENSDLEEADFDSTALLAESFENGWGNDEGEYLFEFEDSNLDTVVFDTTLGADNDAETFEQVEASFVFIRVEDAIIGETYEVEINQRKLALVSATTNEFTLKSQLLDMINNSPEPVTAVSNGPDGSMFVSDDELPTTSIAGVDGPPTGSGPSITIVDVVDLGWWSQNELIEGFVAP